MRKKDKAIMLPIISREGLDLAVAEVATLKIQYAAAKATMELEIARIQESCQEQILSLARQIEVREAGVFVYCHQHKTQLFPEKKSIDFLLATVGFRSEPPGVGKCFRRDTWTTIAKRLKALPWGAQYVNVPDPEVDKKALLADRDRLTLDQLSEAGIRFEQDELFYISPKSEVATRTVVETE